MAKQGRSGHHRIGARQQVFDYLICTFNAGAGRKRSARQLTGKQGEPKQTKSDLAGAAECDIVAPTQANEIDIGLIEAVEQD
jgi:hypothetical protein